MRTRTRRLARTTAAVAIVSGAFGVAAATITGGEALVGVLSGCLIGLTLTGLEVLLRGRWAEKVRRWPVVLVLLFRTLVYGAAFFVMVHAAAALVHFSWEPILHPTRLLSNFTILLSFGFAFAVNLAFMLGRLIGPRILVSLVTGRYHRPREEQRIVLFMDLRGSTQLAERIGDAQFHRFLNRVFWDVTDPVLEAGGEIYRYVGDEIIVTWPAARGARNAACVECVFAVEDALARRRTRYLAEFGAEPRLRAALHAGPLIVGEMGDVKREIVMLGDTMNTTARIEAACRTMGKDYIASGPVLRLSSLPPGVSAESLGTVALRGKEREVELFALARG
jgi:adenylate cyclase